MLVSGFINIDCGYTGGSSYVDPFTGLNYTDDSQFIDTGENYLAASNTYARQYGTLRSFPNSTRNCYKISPVQFGGKYLIRAGFYYGNYDGQSSSPIFDLHVGVNYWTTVEIGYGGGYTAEIVTVLLGEIVQVCLVNTGKGTPFISVLELKPLPSNLYPVALGIQSLDFQSRWNYGYADQLRYLTICLLIFRIFCQVLGYRVKLDNICLLLPSFSPSSSFLFLIIFLVPSSSSSSFIFLIIVLLPSSFLSSHCILLRHLHLFYSSYYISHFRVLLRYHHHHLITTIITVTIVASSLPSSFYFVSSFSFLTFVVLNFPLLRRRIILLFLPRLDFFI